MKSRQKVAKRRSTNPPNNSGLKRKREPAIEPIEGESAAKKLRMPKAIDASMKTAVKREDAKKFKQVVKECVDSIDKRFVGAMPSKHLVKKDLKSSKLLHFLASSPGYRDAIIHQQWQMVDTALAAVLKIRIEEISDLNCSDYFPALIPLVTLENLHIHHVTRLIQLHEIDFESVRALVLHYGIDLNKPDVFCCETDHELVKMQGLGLFHHCVPELNIEYFNQFITFLVNGNITIPPDALQLRAQVERPKVEPMVDRVATFITHAHSLSFPLVLTGLYKATGMTRAVIAELEARGLDIPWDHYEPLVLAQLGFVEKYLAVEKTPEQEQVAVQSLLASFDRNSAHHFDMLDCLLERTADRIVQTMHEFHTCVMSTGWIPFETHPKLSASLDKMLVLLHTQYPDDNERYEILLKLISDHFSLKSCHGFPADEELYFKGLWSAAQVTNNYNHVEFIKRIFTFAHRCSYKKNIEAGYLLRLFVREPGYEAAQNTIRQLITQHIDDAAWVKRFFSIFCNGRAQETIDFVNSVHDGLTLLEYYIVCFVRHASAETEEPLEAIKVIAGRERYLQPSLLLNTVTDHDEQISVYDFVMRYQDRLPQFVGYMREQEVHAQAQAVRPQPYYAAYPAPMLQRPYAAHPAVMLPMPYGAHPALMMAPPPAVAIAQPPPPPPQRRRPINLARQVYEDRQSTHTVSIHTSVSESATRLMDRYFPNLATRQTDMKAARTEFAQYMRQKILQAFEARLRDKYSQHYSPEIIQLLVDQRMGDLQPLVEKSANHLEKIPGAFEGVVEEGVYQAFIFMNKIAIAPFVDPRSKIMLLDSFALVWKTLRDPEVFPTSEDQEGELREYIRRLLELKNEYGTDHPSCKGGMFNANIEFFDLKSPLVQIDRLSSETIVQFIKDFFEAKFNELTPEARAALVTKTSEDESYNHAAWLKLVHAHKSAFMQLDEIVDGLKKNNISVDQIEVYFTEIEENGSSMEVILEHPLRRYRAEHSPVQAHGFFAPDQPLPVPQPPQEEPRRDDAMDLDG